MVITNLLYIILLRSPVCGQGVPKVLVAGRKLWTGRGMRGNASMHMHFEGTNHCQRGDTEFRSNAVLPLSYSLKKQQTPRPPPNKTNTEYKLCFCNDISTTREQYLPSLSGNHINSFLRIVL